ncbi:hypothetical protein XENTR_v10005116 [Xenopus tropicalis]|nr:hypothetical protein XENTR_v10005116 [Xenopus tropicalis]
MSSMCSDLVLFFLHLCALVTWGSTLEMSHIDLCEVKNWLMANISRTREQEMKIDGLYQHLLIQPASGVFDDHNKNICPRVCCKLLSRGG